MIRFGTLCALCLYCFVLPLTLQSQTISNKSLFSKQSAGNPASARFLDSLYTTQQISRAAGNNRKYFQSFPNQPARAGSINHVLQGPPQKLISNAAAQKPNSQICAVISGRDYLMQDSLIFWTGDPVATPDGNVIVSGEFGDYSLPQVETGGFCMKTTKDGVKIWGKLFDSVGNTSYDYMNIFKPLVLQNGSILLAGRTTNAISHNDDFVLLKLDNNGNIIWFTTYESRYWQGFNGSGDFFALTDLKEDPATGDLYFTGYHWGGLSTITKVAAADGHVIWSRGYRSWNWDKPFGLSINPANLVLFTLEFTSYNDEFINAITINKSTGDTVSSKHYRQTGDLNAARLYSVNEMRQLNNGHFLLSGPTTRFFEFPVYTGTIDLYHAAVIELDENFNYVKAYGFKNKIESNGYNSRISAYPDGTGIFTMLKFISGYTAETQICLFKNDTIYHKRKRLQQNEGIPYEPVSLQLSDGGSLNIKLTGDSTVPATSGSRIDYYRVHTADTSSACLGVPDSSTNIWYLNFEEVYGARIDSAVMNVFKTSRTKTYTSSDFSSHKAPGCAIISNCDTLHLSVTPSTVCIGSTATLSIHKNKECGSLVPLAYDTTIINQLTRINDSTYLLHFNAAGNIFIHGSLAGCQIIKDSVPVTVLAAGGPVNLGADTVICPGITIILNAHRGYISYKWQDGSTDSTFTVTQPGQYYVTTVDACGSQFSDTVYVTPHPPVPLSLGADRIICKGDTVHIDAPAGFLNYTWLPAYNINSLTGQHVIITPFVDTSYSVKAEKIPGCFAYDTIRIHVNKAPDIYLGSDKSFCSGDSLLLDAGTGFIAYSWNTGQTSQQIMARTAGQYAVNAVDVQGCHSYDTLKVNNVYPLPAVTLNHNALLCAGENRVLDAGAGYNGYSWNTGQNIQTIIVSTPGLYAVTVTNNNGCKGSDSTKITTLAALPAGFLPADTAICNYGTYELKASGNYNSYLWSTGSHNTSVTLTQSGIYRLTVQDGNNCTGTDSISIVVKECLKGLFVPTGFTPNKDGKNDLLKPVLAGNVKQYHFWIYNRYGQTIFETTVLNHGWDGNINGTTQETGGFIWLCTYQLEGEPVKTEKGSFILIR